MSGDGWKSQCFNCVQHTVSDLVGFIYRAWLWHGGTVLVHCPFTTTSLNPNRGLLCGVWMFSALSKDMHSNVPVGKTGIGSSPTVTLIRIRGYR